MRNTVLNNNSDLMNVFGEDSAQEDYSTEHAAENFGKGTIEGDERASAFEDEVRITQP